MAKKAKTKAKSKSSPTRLEIKAAAIAACRDSAGRVTPRSVWQAAKEEGHPLHNEFDWDVKRAAEKHWESRAKELIREVRFPFVLEDRQTAVPVYVSDPRSVESSYITTARVAKSGTLSLRVLTAEVDRIISQIKRGENLAAAFNLESSFARMLQQAMKIKTKIEEMADGDDAHA